VTTPIEPRPELDALLGAYVLDAIEAEERALVDAYIVENPRAHTEVDDLRETVGFLGSLPLTDPVAPPALWDRIRAEVEADEPRVVPELAARRGISRRAFWISSVAAAAAVVVAALLALQVFNLNNDLDEAKKPKDIAAQFEQAANAEGAREVDLRSDNVTVGRVVLLPDGTGYMVNDDLQPLDADQTYQLWALTGNLDNPTAISAAVLGPDPEGAGFKIDGDIAAMAMTVERAGGAGQPTNTPFIVAPVA
jgi:anti-sigma-K factor RskA